MKKRRILSLDGGGIRGLITSTILSRLDNDPLISGWLNEVDMIAGTSTGGIIALALAMEKRPDEICRLYECKGDDIFEKDSLNKFIDVKNILSAAYSSDSLKEELYQFFGKVKLGELAKKVAIPTFELDVKYDFDKSKPGDERGWKPKIFHNFSGADNDCNYDVADVALYTSSAPTYFPIANGYIDGGVFANNPSNIAIAQAISRNNIPEERVNLEDISLLSIGAGVTLQYIDEKNADWGGANWLSPLLDILMEGVTGISDYQAKQLLGDRYDRIQVYLQSEDGIELDSIDKIQKMQEIANELDISKTVKWVDKYWC